MPESRHTPSDYLVPLFACYFDLSFCYLQLKEYKLRGYMWRVFEYKLPLLPSSSYIIFPDILQTSGYNMIP